MKKLSALSLLEMQLLLLLFLALPLLVLLSLLLLLLLPCLCLTLCAPLACVLLYQLPGVSEPVLHVNTRDAYKMYRYIFLYTVLPSYI